LKKNGFGQRHIDVFRLDLIAIQILQTDVAVLLGLLIPIAVHDSAVIYHVRKKMDISLMKPQKILGAKTLAARSVWWTFAAGQTWLIAGCVGVYSCGWILLSIRC